MALNDKASLGVCSVSLPGWRINIRDRVTRPSWHQRMYLQWFTIHWNTTLLGTSGARLETRARNEIDVEKLPPEAKRHHRGRHGLGVFQYNCESLQAPDRLCELMALAKRTGADVACLQSTLFDGIGEWTKRGHHFFSVNRSGPRQKRWMHDCGQHQVPSHSDQNVEWGRTLGRVLHQCIASSNTSKCPPACSLSLVLIFRFPLGPF